MLCLGPAQALATPVLRSRPRTKPRVSLQCMGRSLWLHLILIFFLVPVFDLVRDFDIVQPYRYGVGFYQTSPEAPPCACTSAVAPPQDWNLLVGPHSTATSFSGLVRPSFERLWSPSCHCQSHAIAERTLAVPSLQTIAQTQCRALPNVPAPVADGDGSLLCPRNQAAASDGSSATATMELSWRASVLPGREFTSQCEVPKKVSKSKEEIPKGRQRQGQLRIWPSCAVPVLPAFATSGLCCWTTITSTEWAPAALGSTWSSNHDAYDEHDANAVPSSSAYKQLGADLCSSGYADSGGAYDDSGEGAERVVDLFAEAFCGSPSGRATEGPDGVSQAWQESYQGPPSRSQVLRRGQNSLRGILAGTFSAYQFLEILFGRGGEELDRLRQDVRAKRTCPPSQDFRCARTVSRSQRVLGRFQNVCGPGHRDQRRREAPRRVGDVGHADHRKHPDAIQLSSTTLQGRGIHPCGRTSIQETQNRGRSCWRRLQAAFQLGGLHMTLWYSSRKPDALDFPAVAALKWSHGIISETDFCCEMGAREVALNLAFELELDGLQHVIPIQRSTGLLSGRKRPLRHVGFAEVTNLRLSFEDDWDFHEFCLPSDYFATGTTPWSGCPKIAEMHRSRFHVCPWHEEGHARSCETPHVLHGQRIASTSEVNSEQAVADPSSSHGMGSIETVGCISSSNERHVRVPGGIIQVKITDNYYDNPARRFQQTPDVPDPDVIPDITEAPQFAQDLHAIADQHGIYEDPEGDGVLRIRTWYLHHQHVIVNFHPRIVELDEDWRRWSDDIVGAWRTHIQAGPSIYFHLVTPDPYRGYLRQPVHCDIILTQGNDLPRRAGLLTVHYQGDQLDPHTYAVASSLELVVSGRRLVEAADANQWCLNSLHSCSISFGWQHIPFDFQQVHQVQNGHAFIITVFKAPQEEDRTHVNHEPLFELPIQEHDYEEPPPDDDNGHSPHSEHSDSSHSSEVDNEFGLRVYRLGQAEDHCFVRWRSYQHILFDITNILGIQRHEVIGMHYLRASPVGIQQEHERAVILQMVPDIQAASSEQLILLDLEVHIHALPNGQLVPPAVSRRVMRIHPPVHRSQILMLNGLNDYCELHGDQCIIFENNVLWPANDRTVHHMQHGTYIRIQVPPPEDPLLDTLTAIAISRDFALESDRGQASTFCQGNPPTLQRPSLHDGDGHSLFQLSIKQFIDVCSDWQLSGQPSQLKVAPDQVVHPGVPTSGPGAPQRLPPPRPLSRYNDRDFDALSNLFTSDSLIECEEEGPIAYVDTWYIHHERQPICREPRAVKLFQDPAQWLEDLLEPWRDVIDPEIDIVVYLVRPTHPCTRMECILAHLIIEQAPRPEHVVGLITSHEADFRGAVIDHKAFSLPSLMSARAVIRLDDLQEKCNIRNCEVRRGAIPLDDFELDHMEDGINLVIFIRAQGFSPFSTVEEDDAIDLMQRPQGAAHPPGNAGGFAFNPNAAAFCPGQAPLNVQPETIQDLHERWRRTAFSWEGESASTSVLTWFVDQYHPHLRICWQPRIVRLFEDFDTWERAMNSAWLDVHLQGAPILFHIVLPTPPNTGPEIAAHVLLVQNPQDTLSSSVVSVFENTAAMTRLTHQLAITTQEHLFLEHVIFGLGLEGRCLYPGSPSVCNAWVGTTALRLGHPYPARDGDGLILQLSPRPNFQQQQAQVIGANNLLQIGTRLITKRERRLTHGQVAHTHGPLHIQEPQETRVVRTISAGCNFLQLPDFVELPEPVQSRDVQKELENFGLFCEVRLLSTGHVALCFDTQFSEEAGVSHLAYLSQEDPWRVHLHTATSDLISELEHMRFLYTLGYEKAVILQELRDASNFTEIHFTEAKGEMHTMQKNVKELPPWPAHQTKRELRQMYQPEDDQPAAECNLNCGIQVSDLIAFFTSTKGTLCTSFDNLDLPEVCSKHFETLAHHSRFDRLVIYADGSSQASRRHIAPLLNEEVGVPDAWCFLVLGETYTSNSTSEISLIGWSAHQVRCGPEQDWHIGADRIGSAIAEREALTWAMLWRIGQNSNIPTVFRSDSMLSLQQARGDIGTICCDESFQILRGCAQLLETALAPGDFILDHIPGHAGDPYNEFCDWGAKCEGRQGFFLKRPALDMSTWRPLFPFLWMLFDQQAGIPQFRGSGFAVNPPALPPEEPPGQPPPKVLHCKTFDFTVSIATGNVLSLGQGPAGFAGKLDYLRSQFKDLHLNFLGVQETRAEAGSSVKHGILRLSSGAANGVGGVELWCNLAQPIATSNGKQICLAKNHFTVVCHDSRRLLVHVLHEVFEAWILVGYAPHSGHSMRDREQWWKSTQDIVNAYVDDQTPLFVCIDANAGPGEADGKHVLLPGFRTSSGSPLLQDFLRNMRLCAPITSAFHEGSTCTWTSPTQEEFTIDYVLLPEHWLERCASSCILEDFDLGNKTIDHAVHAVELKWQQQCTTAKSSGRPPASFERNNIQSNLPASFRPFPVASWQTDVEQHLAGINTQFLDQIAKHCPKPRRGPQRPYIDEEIWKLRKRKLDHKAQLKCIRQLLRRETLARLFAGWKRPHSWAQEQSFCFGTTLRIGILKHGLGFRRLAAKLKEQIHQNKRSSLQAVIGQFSSATAASEIQQKLRPFMGSSHKLKQGLAPLPLIKDAQGRPCASHAASLQRWIEFFSEMEGGERMSEPQQRALWRDNLESLRTLVLDIPITEMPSLAELEHVCRQVSAGKASGMDNIPSELMRYCPKVVARQLYSLLLKIAVQGQEPLEHKGGYLIPIWKGKLSKDCCHAFRSILISSMVGKTIHKALRTKQMDLYQRFLHPQQLGGRKGISVVLCGHLVRAFLRIFAAKNQPTAVIFIDLQEAFYRVVRPLAISGPWTDDLVASMAERLQLDRHILHDLYEHLSGPSAVEQAQMSATAQRAIQALHSDTFFALPGQVDRVRTRHGSRPGDSYADVVFGYLMSRVLKSFAASVENIDILSQFPDEPTIDLHSRGFEGSDRQDITLLGPCWMDDLAIPLTAPDNAALLRNVQVATSSILDTMKSHAMTPNLGPGKTEILLKPRGRGTQACRKQLFGPQAPGFVTSLGEYGSYRVNLVNSYVHLGGITHYSGDLRREIRRRVAIAHQSFNKHRKLIYQNTTLPLSRRSEIFASLILSRLLYGAETWTINDLKTKEYLHCALIKLFKRLLKCSADDHISDEEVLHKIAMPSPATLLRIKRLGYLSSLLNSGPAAHWGLLNRDQQWLDLIRDDLQWMGDQLAQSCSLGNPFEHTDRWLEIMRFHRG